MATLDEARPAEPEEPTPSTPPAAPRRRLRLRRALIGTGIVVVLYLLAGWLLAPRLIHDAIEERGSALLVPAVQLGEVRVNPLTLAVTLERLELKPADAPAVAGFDRLYVRFAPWRILVGRVGVAEIVLARPFVRATLSPEGNLDLASIVRPAPPGTAPAPPAAGAPAKKEKGLDVALDRLEIDEMKVVFVDQSRKPTFETTLGPLSIRLTDFHSGGGVDSPYTFQGSTESGETFAWSGTVDSAPVRSAGTLSFSKLKLPKYAPYARDQTPDLDIAGGELSLETRYDLAWVPGQTRFGLSGLKVTLDGLALGRRGGPSPLVTVPRIEVSGGEVDVIGQVAKIAEVRVTGGRIAARREANGKLPVVEMGRLAPSPPSKWQWSVGAVQVAGVSVAVEDLVPRRPVRFEVSDLAVKLADLSSRPSAAGWPLSVQATLPGPGALRVTGAVVPEASRGKLAVKADAVDLAPLGPYLDESSPLRLAAARLGLALDATFDAAGKVPAWSVKGSARLDGLSMRDPRSGEELLSWRSLEATGIDAASKPQHATLARLRWVEPKIRAVVDEDGTTAFTRAEKKPAAAEAEGKPAGAKPAAAPAKPAGTMRAALKLLRIERGQLGFADRSVTPPAVLTVGDLDVRVTGLSSDPGVRSDVSSTARVDGAAPVEVKGTVNPLQASGFTDLAVKVRAVDLTPLGPYSGKFLGYGLQKGKLDLDLAWKVADRKVTSANVIRTDQLTLGEKVESPDATGLPVRLAISLLTDKDGVILLDVPVEGSLDDPDFRWGRAAWHAVKSLLVKVAASPFKLLASLAGDDRTDISLVEFAPGSSALDDPSRQRVAKLVDALKKRPALALELEAGTDVAADGTALRRATLEAKLREAKAGRPVAAADAVTIAPEERPRLLAALAERTLPPPPPPPAGAKPAPPDPAAVEARLVAAQPLPPEALQALAAARATGVREALLAAGLEPGRIFQVEGSERAAKEPGPRVWFTVR